MTERKRAGVEFWIVCAVTVLVVLPMLYVASFGPACWLVRRQGLSAGVPTAVYRPLVRLACTDHGMAGRTLRWLVRRAEHGEFGLFAMGVHAGHLEWPDGTSSTVSFTGGLLD
jgi:hypothetical protein